MDQGIPITGVKIVGGPKTTENIARKKAISTEVKNEVAEPLMSSK